MKSNALTRKKDLRDGTTVWSVGRAPRVHGARLLRSVKTEVIIVGAGISGALLAQSLAALGFRPLIIDRRRQALLGSTAASTALLQFELDTPLVQLSRRLGKSQAGKVWIASRDAVNELRTRTLELDIAAHLETRPSLYLAGDVLNARGLRQEAALRQRIGLASEFLDGKSLRRHFGIMRTGAILSHRNAEANPVELAAGYLRRAIRDGARFHAPHEVIDVAHSRSGVTLATRDGLELQARRVVFCTGYELARIVPASGSRVSSTWAMATRPQPQRVWPQKALIWEASDPYLYVRSTQDGRVICGGEDMDMADTARRDALRRSKTLRLQDKLHALLPAIDAAADVSWTGSFASSTNGMPTIGAIPGHRQCYAVLGYGGNGITFSMLACKILTFAIQGKEHPEAKLFEFA